MNTAKIIYTGKLSTTMTHLRSGAEVSTDAPIDNQGKGEAFSPTDMAASSLASCLLTIMGIKARDKGWNIEGSSVQLEKVMTSNPRRIDAIRMEIKMQHNVEKADDRALLEKVARACPVALSLHPDIKQELVFYW